MLASLGKWLRTAGYDTKIIETAIDDHEVLDLALKEDRILLTRDQHFLKMKNASKTLIHLKGNFIEDNVKELNSILKLHWLYKPFSRCLICNSPFIEPDAKTILEQVPEDVRASTNQFRYCAECKKVYWMGSHTEHMLKQLQEWEKI